MSPKTDSTDGRLFVLDLSGGIIFSINVDGSDRKDLVTGCRQPDGLVVDVEGGYIYFQPYFQPRAQKWS